MIYLAISWLCKVFHKSADSASDVFFFLVLCCKKIFLCFISVSVLFVVSEFVFMVLLFCAKYTTFRFVCTLMYFLLLLCLCYWAIKLGKLWRSDGFMIIFNKLLFCNIYSFRLYNRTGFFYFHTFSQYGKCRDISKKGEIDNKIIPLPSG